jgi:4-aminobutyrate aminotransferase / (S)-3-amino-2-methylpropionate transaminase / 5-aminovalerate transaminase
MTENGGRTRLRGAIPHGGELARAGSRRVRWGLRPTDPAGASMSLDVAQTLGGPALAQERRLVTAIPGPRSVELQARRAAAVSAGVGGTLPAFIVAAGGGVLVDVDGNSLIDMGSGIAVTNVGNAAPKVVEAVQRQVAEFTHTCFMVTPYEGYVAVCEALNELTPGDHAKRSALFNSGAEAVENAVKIARAYTRRQAVVAFEHGYHGRTNLTMALTAKNMPYKHSFGPFAPEVYRVPLSYPFRDAMSGPEAAKRAISRIDKEVGAENVAAIVIEPIAGEGGFIVPGEGFLPELVEYARASGIVFVADEIQTGFCRTGDWFACDHEGVVPDLITTAKGIAGGLPLAAVTGRAEMMDSVHVGGLGGTYGGNPVACAAALGAIEEMREHDLVGAARRIGDVMVPRLRTIADRSGRIGDVRGRGAMVAVEVVVPGTTEPDAATTAAVARACHADGVVVLTAGTDGNVLRLLPPLTMPEHLLFEALDVIERAFLAQ